MDNGKLIILPVDGSRTAEAAARFAVDIARAEHDTILVLGVAQVFHRAQDQAVTNAIHAFMSDVVAAEASRIRESGAAAEELVVDAEAPYEAILEVADQRGADLIVMGTHGRTGLARTVIGSVADRVVRHADIPVVLVPLKIED